jgi:putative tricarboxylic transport membrane protein
MDALSALVEGFRVALTPINLLWALAGRDAWQDRGGAAGDRPRPDRRAAPARDLQLPPIEAFIMFAGIYYGGCTAARRPRFS